jgi:hypothetical protein
MKDVAPDEGIPTKFVSRFLEFYFIFYEFLINMNEQVVNKGVSFFPAFLHCTHRMGIGVGTE